MEEENVFAKEQAPEEAQKAPEGDGALLGKFKDADALMKAYTELEAEFTRRSQRLKALEENKAQEAPAPSPEREAESGSEALYRAVTEHEDVRERVIGEYLSSLRGVPLMTKGRGIVAPAQKPKTFAEAGSLALGYFKNKQ